MSSTRDLVRFLSLAAALLAVAALVIAFTMGRNCSRSAFEASIANEIRDVPPAFNMTSAELVQVYRDDEESASATYNGTTGIVQGPALLVEQSNHLRFFVDRVWAVRCFLSDEQLEAVRTLDTSSKKVYLGGTFEFRTGAGWPVAFSSLPAFTLKGRVEGVNNKILTVDIRGCTIQSSP